MFESKDEDLMSSKALGNSEEMFFDEILDMIKNLKPIEQKLFLWDPDNPKLMTGKLTVSWKAVDREFIKNQEEMKRAEEERCKKIIR